MKIIVVCNKDNLDKYKKIGAQAFIFGLKDFSSGYDNELSVQEIKELVEDNKDSEIFISINKNIFNEELDELKDNLLELDKLSIKGILFYDVAILKFKKDLNLKTPLVWNCRSAPWQ